MEGGSGTEDWEVAEDVPIWEGKDMGRMEEAEGFDDVLLDEDDERLFRRIRTEILLRNWRSLVERSGSVDGVRRRLGDWGIDQEVILKLYYKRIVMKMGYIQWMRIVIDEVR